MEGSLADSILQVCKILNKHYALEELGQDISHFKAEKSPNPKKSFFRLEYDKFTVDFLPELPGLSRFHYSYSKCEVSKIGEIEIPY